MKVESIAECSLGAFCNTFDLHLAITGLENQFLVFLRVAVLDRFWCIGKEINTICNVHNVLVILKFSTLCLLVATSVVS